MDLIPELRESHLNYLPLSTLEKIPEVLNESSKHKKVTINSEYSNYIKSGKACFRQLCHDLTVDYFAKELTDRVNRAKVCNIWFSYPKIFAKGYIGSIYSYRNSKIGGRDIVNTIYSEDKRKGIPKFPEFEDKEDEMTADDHVLSIERVCHEDRLVLNNTDDEERTSSRNIINREEYESCLNSLTEEISTLEESSIESGIAIGNDHSQEQHVKPKRRWKKSEESEDEDYIIKTRRKKNLYY